MHFPVAQGQRRQRNPEVVWFHGECLAEFLGFS